MLKYSVVLSLLLIIIIVTSGCVTETEKTQNNILPPENDTSTETTEGPNAKSTENPNSTITELGPDAAGDCSLLTPEDILNVCGVNTTIEIQELRTEDVCSTRLVKDGTKYADRIDQSITIRYVTDYDPDTDDVNAMIESIVDKLDAERLSNYAVFIPLSGDWSVIYGTKYKVVVHNTMPSSPNIICTPDQIKELGILVSERIYG